MGNVISYGEYQSLSEAEKANYIPHWNSDGKSGVAYKKGYTPQKTTFESTASIGPADPNSKSVITKEEARKAGVKTETLPTQFELEHPILTGSKATDSNGWIDNDGNVHLNSRATESRTAAAEEDRATGADYRTAKAPSQRELDMRNGTFDSKTYEGNYTWSDEEIVNGRNKARADGDTELEKKFQAEINRRNADGQTHSWTAADKHLAAARAEAAAPKAEDTSKYHIGENTEGSEFVGEEETETSTKDDKGKSGTENTKNRKDDYWTNFLYGNGYGSVKNDADAKAEKEKKQDDFLKSNPSLFKAIFGKDSGLNFGERVARLGEMLAMIGSDATRGAYAGFNHQALPEATKGKYNEIYKQALENQYGRKQDVFESENKANIDKANRVSMLSSTPAFEKAPEGLKSELADLLITGATEDDWLALKSKYKNENLTDEEWSYMKKSFENTRNNYSDITTQRGNVVDLNTKEFDLKKNKIDVINALNQRKIELRNMLVELAGLQYEKLIDFMTRFTNVYKGIQNVSTSLSEAKEFGYNASTSVKGGIPVIHGSVEGGVNGGTQSTSGSTATSDILALTGMADGKKAAEMWNKSTSYYRNTLEKTIEQSIQEIDEQIKALNQEINDGIVKAPHMKQWLVREDGTRVALNPDDSIYATKNKLTTKKDDKSDIVPMEKEDKVVVIQKRLGHCGDKRIEKKTDYYLSKLK